MVDLITLVRNHHSGICQAEKLEPYIMEADVVSFEDAFCAKSLNSLMEKMFNSWFSMRYHLGIRAIKKEFEAGDGDIGYTLGQFQLIKKHKKKVVQAEGFSDEVSEQLQEVYEHLMHQPRNEAYLLGFDEAVFTEMGELFDYVSQSELRNERIVHNIRDTLQKVRKISKGDGHYLITLGAGHNIGEALHEASGIAVRDVSIPYSGFDHLNHFFMGGKLVADANVDEDVMETEVPVYIARSIFADVLYDFFHADHSFLRYAIKVHLDYLRCGDIAWAQERIAEKLKSDVLEPVSNFIASQCSYDEIRSWTREAKDDIQKATVNFLKTKGIHLPFKTQDYTQWDALFPYHEKKSEEPVVRMFTP